MSLLVASAVLVVSVSISFILSFGMYKHRKYIVWGICTIFAIAPFLTWIFSTLYGVREGSGFASIALMMIMFPILIIIGIVILFVGIYRLKLNNGG
ncbi:hypothetical protein H1D32_10085 [Anaerobacillus sp. CMMVII]|uniref:hypothetical protein n=1 Tax=Anaerobacillus sp. CMMVII TaxID=2755588 RepID=UPI0021B84C96|nr:hypothetical protein [Anaerobacillus sp. CMMVII]MCT8138074.1 hypothetical protein [Anaerobacillus sp. CMMVII]